MPTAEVLSIRPVTHIIEMPWTAFNAESGAWSLHPKNADELDPVVSIDEFFMPTPTFPPHPHAGFSAVTYLFTDSEDGFINRDSLGNHLRIDPGSLHWTQAGTGVLHEELPASKGKVVHGLQMFVNSSTANKHTAPAMFHRAATDVARVTTESGAVVRVVLGRFGDVDVPFPAHTPLTLLDIELPPHTSVTVPSAAATAFALVITGELITAAGSVGQHHAVRFTGNQPMVQLQSGAVRARVVMICGAPLNEPVVQRGPFIANSAVEADEMMAKFKRGEMGALSASVA